MAGELHLPDQRECGIGGKWPWCNMVMSGPVTVIRNRAMCSKSCLDKIIPKWSFLRKLRTNRFVASTYIWLIVVPAAAKAASGLEDTFAFTANGITHSISLSLPFSWQIFFLSALSFVIGNVVFFLRAPRFSKMFGDYGEFIKTGGLVRHLEAYKTEAQESLDTELERMQELAGIQPTNRNSDEYAREIFWKLHETYDDLRFGWRTAAAFFYLLGFGLFLWVAIQNSCWALRAIFL